MLGAGVFIHADLPFNSPVWVRREADRPWRWHIESQELKKKKNGAFNSKSHAHYAVQQAKKIGALWFDLANAG